MKNVSSGKTIRDSIERIDNYLREKGSYVTLFQISQDLHLHFNSVKKCIDTLQKFGRVDVVTNGNVTLIQFRRDYEKESSSPN